MPKWLYEIFNLLFISIYQNLLLMSLAFPAYIAAVIQPHTSLSKSDIALAVTALVVLGLEFTADNQQWSYHTFKHAFLGTSKETYDPRKQWPGAGIAWTPEDAKRGFITKGLWAWSRHPNFACEQGFWVSCFHASCQCSNLAFGLLGE
jgi:steroid 5-alpha reductase family enzyme